MLHLGLRHKHERQMAGKPAPETPRRYVKALDRITFVAGVVGPFTVLPQIYDLYWRHEAAGVSPTAWALMFVVTMPWIFYGIVHREKSIIYSFILWEVVNAAVFVGALIYR